MVTKPTPGQDPWNAAMDAALDELQADIDAEVDRATEAETSAKLLAVRTVAVNTTLTDADDVVLVSSGNRTITLHDADTAAVKWYTVQNMGTGVVSVVPPAGQTINGAASFGPMTQNQLSDFLPAGGDWRAM